ANEPLPVTWSALAPLALPDLPEAIGRRLVEEHLLSSRFWTPLAPPSVAADEPSFSLREHSIGLRRYWRGPTWINSAWLVWLGLVRLGYAEQAATLAAAQPPPHRELAARGLERTPQSLPGGARLLQVLERVGHYTGHAARLQHGGLAQRVVDALGKRRGALGSFERELRLAALREHERAQAGGVDRVADQARALAHLERLRQRGVGLGELAGVATCDRQANQGVERDLGPADLLRQLARATQELRGGLPLALAPAEQAAHRV